MCIPELVRGRSEVSGVDSGAAGGATSARMTRIGPDERDALAAPAVSGERTTASLGLWPWVQLASSRGMSVERFCELAGVQVTALRDPEVRFSQLDANRVALLAFEHFGPGAAMHAALAVEAGQFNLLELIARSAPTVSAGLAQGCQFFPLLHDGGRLICEQRDGGAVALRWHPPEYAVHHGYVELTFAVALLGIRREAAVASVAPAELCFSHPAPNDRSAHDSVFGTAARFGAGQDAIVFDRQAAALPLTRDNPDVHAAARKAAADLIDD
jgi:hypothetical protein